MMNQSNNCTFTSPQTLILDAKRKETKAKQYMNEGRYEDAVLLFKEALKVKQAFVDIPPYISMIDIVNLHMMIGDTLTSCGLRRRNEAIHHLRMAWTLCDAHYGDKHPITEKAREKYCIYHIIRISAAAA
jgi:hypothetical protein